MSRARILADYVSSGDELADKAPLASPAFTGTPTGITAAHLEAGVLPSDVTGGSGLTALGTVATGDLSNSAIVYPDGHVLKITNYNPTRSPSSSYTSGTNVVASLSFTPLALTESLKIDFQQAFQRYGNNASGSASGKFGFTHNGTLLPNGATLVSDHDNDNYSNSFRRTVHQHFTFYIPVGHASASGARTISMDCRPTTGRYHYESDAGSWGVTGFTITEFRG